MTWPMIGATTLVDAGELQLFDRVRDLVQVRLRKMEILRRGLKIFVSEQKLDRAQVGAGFK